MLESRINQSLKVIRKAEELASPNPLIINYSGGKDSRLLLDLVRQVTNNFIGFYAVSGIEFPEVVDIVKQSCKQNDVQLMISYPTDYKGDFFQRLEVIGYFPTPKYQWCSKDLKFRPQRKVLVREFGKKRFYKLNGVRKHESARREVIYGDHHSDKYFITDFHIQSDTIVMPILDWTNAERDQYFKRNQIIVESNSLYDKYTVSGCYYCPFYQSWIYRKVLRQNINIYDKFIEWEKKLGKPSVIGNIYLKNLKNEVKFTRKITEYF